MPTKRLVKRKVLRGRDEPLLRTERVLASTQLNDGGKERTGGYLPDLAADDMCYLHQMVINHIRQVVGRKAIRLQDDKVFLWILLLKLAVNGISELGTSKGIALQANHMSLSLCTAAVGLGRIDGTACAWINSRPAGVMKAALLRLELLRGAEAAVGVASVNQSLNMMLVGGQSLRLYKAGQRAGDSSDAL